MKVAYASDLHLEFGGTVDLVREEAKYLFLLGDIVTQRIWKQAIDPASGNYEKILQMMKPILDACEHYEKVFLIPGNHDYYHGTIQAMDFAIEEYARWFGLTNLVYMQDTFTTLEDFTIYGNVAWTHMPNINEAHLIEMSMNDFKLIRDKGYRKFSATTAHCFHAMFLDKVDRLKPDIILQHHAPHRKSIDPRFANSDINAGYYSTRMSDLLDARILTPKYIFHGHIHHFLDYTVQDTRVLCNPRGYYRYEDTDMWTPQVVELIK